MATQLSIYDALRTLMSSGNPADYQLAVQVSNETGIPLPSGEGQNAPGPDSKAAMSDGMIGGSVTPSVDQAFGTDFMTDVGFTSPPGLDPSTMGANPANAKGTNPSFNDQAFQDAQAAAAAAAGKARSGVPDLADVPGSVNTGWGGTVSVANPNATTAAPTTTTANISPTAPVNVNDILAAPVTHMSVQPLFNEMELSPVAPGQESSTSGVDPSEGPAGAGSHGNATSPDQDPTGGIGAGSTAQAGPQGGENDGGAGGGSGGGGGGSGGGSDAGSGTAGAGQSGEGGQWKKGGIIPGPKGKQRTIKAHSGEFVMNEDATDIIGADKLADLNRFALKAKAGQKANRRGDNGPLNAQDTEIAHVTPSEKKMLSKVSGGEKTNPTSNLPAFFSGEADAGESPGGGGQAGSASGGGSGGDNSAEGSPAGDGGGVAGGNVDGAPAGDPNGGQSGPADGGVGSTEAFGGHDDWRQWQAMQEQKPVYYIPAPAPPAPSQVVATDINKMVKDLETYQPIAYTGNWLTYASPSGTFGGAQHRFQRRTNDPIEGNVNVYQGDKTYDTTAWPNVPVAMLGPVNASLPGGITGLGIGPTGPYARLKQKSGYGIMGLV